MSGERSIILFLVLFLALVFLLQKPTKASVLIRCKAEERQALLDFKQGLDSPHPSSWGSEDDKKDCCTWTGVVCSDSTGHVMKLVLPGSMGTVRTISPSLLKLHHLSYLDLSVNDFNGSRIPEFIGSLRNLRYLDLSQAWFGGPIPWQLGNLSRLETLFLSSGGDGDDGLYNVGKLEWLSRLSSLKTLDLGFNDLSQASDWSQVITKLRFLQVLFLEYCSLPSVIPSSLSLINASTSLTNLNLKGNNLTSSALYTWFFNVSSRLVTLDLSLNQLKGSIPEVSGNIAGMEFLDLSNNQLEGEIPGSFSNMCNLKFLFLSSNYLNGEVTTFLQNISRCTMSKLTNLKLSDNQFTGSVPNEIANLLSLESIFLGYNRLSGNISESIGQLSNLGALQLSGNSFNEVVVSEAHFSNLSMLQHLELSDSFLTLKFNSAWIPPFQLMNIYLRSCKLGPLFPKWFRSQSSVGELDISATGISDSLPSWFWEFQQNLDSLNISLNQISGAFPNSSLNVRLLDLSSNNLTGVLPPIHSRYLQLLNLSKNKFSGSISSVCNIESKSLAVIDLSHNLFHGMVPNCFSQWPVQVINLANNNFSGPIPGSLGSSTQLKMLNLRGNNFSGGLPLSLKNCGDLLFLDLSSNELSGKIPIWIGICLPSLVFLNLGANQFDGSIPHQLCGLRLIQILDLSRNKISGTIPHCLNNFTSMTQKVKLGMTIEHSLGEFDTNFISYAINYVDDALLTWKGVKREYAKILGLLLVIDLSSNKLVGGIPEELTSLQELVALNLSRNFLNGTIPRKIGKLRQLESLDLSRNNFSGSIPISLSELTFLSTLDLSYNCLWGKIPTGTQLQRLDPSAFSHNHGLCGPPVTPNCSEVETPQSQIGGDEDDFDEFTKWFYAGMGLGFVVGFWGFCGAFLLKRSWRHSYFRLLDKVNDWVYVTFAMQKAKLKRRIGT